MRFKIDENLHDEVAGLLRDRGHDVHTVHEEGLRGADDRSLADRCRTERRVLVSLDLDFADIRVYPPADYAGLIVLRLGHQSRSHLLGVLPRVLEFLEHQPIAGRLWIASDHDIRIRGE